MAMADYSDRITECAAALILENKRAGATAKGVLARLRKQGYSPEEISAAVDSIQGERAQ